MGNPYGPSKDWRYNWYSIGAGLLWALWYSIAASGTTTDTFVRFLAGMGAGGTVAYLHNTV